MRTEVLAKEELKIAKPCPFCGRPPVYFVEDLLTPYCEDRMDLYDDEPTEDTSRGTYIVAVFCLACLVNGPVKYTRQQAINFWNKRVKQ